MKPFSKSLLVFLFFAVMLSTNARAEYVVLNEEQADIVLNKLSLSLKKAVSHFSYATYSDSLDPSQNFNGYSSQPSEYPCEIRINDKAISLYLRGYILNENIDSSARTKKNYYYNTYDNYGVQTTAVKSDLEAHRLLIQQKLEEHVIGSNIRIVEQTLTLQFADDDKTIKGFDYSSKEFQSQTVLFDQSNILDSTAAKSPETRFVLTRTRNLFGRN